MNTIPSRPVKVFDPLLRLTHWWLALAIIALIVTSQLAELLEDGPYEALMWDWHIVSGYALAGGLFVRLIWGFVGPAPARGTDLWHPRAWAGMLKFHWPRPRLGHDAAASLAFIAFYAVSAIMVITGFALTATEFDAGPLAGWIGGASRFNDLFEEPHEAGFVFILLFIAIHVGALVFHHWRGERVAQAMVNGKQFEAQDGQVIDG